MNAATSFTAITLIPLSALLSACSGANPPGRTIAPGSAAETPQSGSVYVRGEGGELDQVAGNAPDTDAELMSRARRLILDGEHDQAEDLLDEWLEAREDLRPSEVPYRPEALLARGDAHVADNDEFKALYDYEALLRDHPESPLFARGVERELEIAKRYARGLKRKAWGVRIFDSKPVAEALLIRGQERLPGSALAEEAAIELADFFYRESRIKLAAEAYQLYLENFPDGPNAKKANERLIFANIARFKGPRYDGSVLLDAEVLIRRFGERYPIDAERTGINEGLIARLDESLAAKLLDSALWYDRTGEPESAKLTLRRLARAYPATISGRTAADLLAERGWQAPAPASTAPGEPAPVEVEGPADASPVSDGS